MNTRPARLGPRCSVCRSARWLVVGACAAVAIAGVPAQAATFVIDILFTDEPDATTLTVETGSRVAYTVVGQVFSDDDTVLDNDGLGGLVFIILTDLGVEQPPADAIDPAVALVLAFATSTGLPDDDDLIEIGGALFDLTNPTTGLALDGPQTLATGELVMPDVEGSFRVMISMDGQANVLVAQDDLSLPFLLDEATFEPGDGVTIITEAPAPVEPPPPPPPTTTDDTTPVDEGAFVVSSAIVAAVTILLGVLGALTLGPIGFVFGLLAGALGSLATLFGG